MAEGNQEPNFLSLPQETTGAVSARVGEQVTEHLNKPEAKLISDDSGKFSDFFKTSKCDFVLFGKFFKS